MHDIALFGMELCISGKHEIQSALTHHVSKPFGPHNIEFLFVVKDALSGSVGDEIDAIGDPSRRFPTVVAIPTKVLHDTSVLGWSGHRILSFVSDGRKERIKKAHMSVDAVRLVMVRECSKAQLVKDTSLIDAQIVLDFIVAPVRQVLGIVVDLDQLGFDSYIVALDRAYFWGGKKVSQFYLVD